MRLEDLVHALMDRDMVAARQWVADAGRLRFEWTSVPPPRNLDAIALAIAAGVAELLAERSGQEPPQWTGAVPPAPEPFFLVQAAVSMPRLRRMCEVEGPEPLRRRGLLAPPEFLTAA